MKNILACTDFSPSGENAIRYAAGLAQATGASLTLLHICHLPVVTGETPIMVYSIEDIEKEAEIHLKKDAADLEKVFGLKPKAIVTTGLAVDEITEMADKEHSDLVVMGTQGIGNTPGVFGGVVYELMQSGKISVIAVPPGYSFKPIHKIVFASDLHKNEHPHYMTLRKLVNAFNAKVFLLSIMKTEEVPSTEKAVAGIELEHAFADLNHEFMLLEGDDMEDRLGHFAENEGAELVVVVPHRHNFFKRMFGKTHTKEMLRYTHLPLLSLCDRKHKSVTM